MIKKLSLAVVVVVVVLGAILLSGCTKSERVRMYGGTMNIDLPKGQRLVTIDWDKENLWLLTRPMKNDEQPDTYQLQEKSRFGVAEGAVIIQEHK
jgi:hypothetical protein